MEINFALRKQLNIYIMKNGNINKLAALLMAMFLMSAISFAQSDKKEDEKQKTIMITMTVDEDGETTKVDSIVFESPDIDIDEIMKDVGDQLDISKEKMKEISEEIEAEIEAFSKTYSFEIEDQKDELDEAMEELKNELQNLDMEKEVQERIQNAMDRIEEAGKESRTQMKRFIIDDDHPVFMDKDGKYEVIVEEDGDEVKTEVIWIDEEGNVRKESSKEVKVLEDSDSDGRMIIKSGGKEIDKENVFVVKKSGDDDENIVIDIEDSDMAMITSSTEKDLDKAIDAGLPINKEKMFEEMDLSIEIKDDQDPLIKIKTEVKGKLKATAYDADFNKLKKLKVTEEDGKSVLQLNDELKESKAAYILLEQGDKTDLMKIAQVKR